MTEVLKREWTVRVQETFEALKWADRDVQERACKSVQKEFSSEEAAAKLRGLFGAEADRMKAAFFVPPPQSRVAEAKIAPAKIAEAKEEKKAAVAFPEASPGFVRRPGIGRVYPKSDSAGGGRPMLKVVEQRKAEPEPEPDEPEVAEPTFADVSGLEVLDPRDLIGRPRLVTPGDAAQKPIVAGLEQWWLAKLSTGETPLPSMKNPRWVLSRYLYEEATAHNARTKYVTETEFGNFLRGKDCEHKSNGKAWGWVFPPLPEARRSWEIRMNGTYQWLRPSITEWNEGTKRHGQ